MCTRFYIDISDKELQEIVEAAKGSALAAKFTYAGHPLSASGEIYPTNVVPVIASSKSGKRSVFPMKWGYAMAGKGNKVSTILNARAETAGEKRTFRDSWREHRCIVPASYYFEWEHVMSSEPRRTDKIKYAIQPEESAITWLCGLYRIENDLPHFVILTREPGDEIRFIHDRMPLILPKNKITDWIDPAVPAKEVAGAALTRMIFEKAV